MLREEACILNTMHLQKKNTCTKMKIVKAKSPYFEQQCWVCSVAIVQWHRKATPTGKYADKLWIQEVLVNMYVWEDNCSLQIALQLHYMSPDEECCISMTPCKYKRQMLCEVHMQIFVEIIIHVKI